MKKPWMFAFVALVLGALGGFISGRNIASDREVGDARVGADAADAAKAKIDGRGKSQVVRDNTRARRAFDIGQISSIAGITRRMEAMVEFYSNLAPEQFELEAAKLDQLPMNERMVASILLFGRWAEVAPAEAMEYSGMLGYNSVFVKPAILRGWASVDPAAAAKYCAANPREFGMIGNVGAASIIGAEWARQNPVAAFAWVKSLGEGRADAIGAVLGQVAKSDPLKASQMLAGVSGADLTLAYQSVAAGYGAKNFAEAQAWIGTLPVEYQGEALASAIGALSEADPASAAEQVRLMALGGPKDRAITEIVGNMARENPREAALFLKDQGSLEAMRMSMRELIPMWVNKDAPNALAYAFALEAGDVRDSALQSYVVSNASADPSQVILVAENIQDEGERIRSMSIAATRWMREDAASARAYVEQSQLLPEADKDRILNGGGWFGGRFGGQRGVGGGAR